MTANTMLENEYIETINTKKLFFAKTSNKAEVDECKFVLKSKSLLNGISVGDYAIVRLQDEFTPASVKRLWKLKDIRETDSDQCEVFFEQICEFERKESYKFIRLNLFVLNQNLLNKCIKMTRDMRFIEISIAESKQQDFNRILDDSNEFIKYINDENNYRQILKYESINDINNESQHVQLYKDEDSWNLYNSDFIGKDLQERFNPDEFDRYKEHGDVLSGKDKGKFFRFLNSDENSDDKNCSLVGLWDLFCCTVKDNTNQYIACNHKITQRQDFIDYCLSKQLKENTAILYEAGIRKIERTYSLNIDEEFKKDKCTNLLNSITNDSRLNENDGYKQQWPSYTKKYIEFKESVQNVATNQNEQHLSTNESNVQSCETIVYCFDRAERGGTNKIYYGIPGCGKSYFVDKIVLGNVIEDCIVRTTFYQDYSYTDFVGQILPTLDENNIVTYKFTPGPFTKALKKAIEKPFEIVFLVIEEINRGNAPSIFGDIFQLLDRDNSGTSVFSIENLNLQRFLSDETNYNKDYIKIPSNLYIYATMNTSDQNVFTLDTAFKRRWKFQLIDNYFKETEKAFYSMIVPGFNISWKKFVEKINEHILKVSNTASTEDKRIGKYFVDATCLLNKDETDEVKIENKKKEFAQKVLEYLWSDVSKFNRNQWFLESIKSFDDLLYYFIGNDQIFVDNLSTALKNSGDNTDD